MQRVLVTGATGFIGHYAISRLLQEGYAVRALIRESAPHPNWGQQVELVRGDIQNVQTMQMAAAGCDTVFHLAGKAHALSDLQPHDGVYQALNVDGTQNVLEGSITCGVNRFVFFSSIKAMGEETLGCLDESFEPCPTTAYGRSKLAAERLVMHYGKQYGLHVVCLRLPLVYGMGNKGHLFRMIAAIDHGRFPPLPRLENRRSMIHATNVVDAALLAATHPEANGQCYIVTDGRAYSTRELYDMICQELGKRIPRWYIPLGFLKALGFVGDTIGYIQGKRFLYDSDALAKLAGSAWYSTDKIASELGYRPSITFAEALPELIAWYRAVQT